MEVDAPSSSTYQWKIENVSGLNEESHFSPIFTVGPHKWRLLAFRRDSNVDGYLSLYVVAIDCIDSRYVKFSLAVVDQVNNQNTLRKDTEGKMFQFTDDESDWGFDDFIKFKELIDLSNGYIVNDACIVEAELRLYSTQETEEELVPIEPMESVAERDPVTSSTLPSSTSDNNSAFICGFCQTSQESEGSGPMLHILANGQEVQEDELSGPNVIHVHRICLNWTPQLYYVGETLMNMEVELARGAKLKCSCCGLKGAALGCFASFCKNTYHVPCALETAGCRWYDEGYLLLCPTHSYMKFPHERKKKRKKPAKDNSPAVHRKRSEAKVWAAPASATGKVVLCGASLSAEEKILLANFAKISGLTVSENLKPNVTHVIASTDEKGACRRSFRFLKAILDGKWVLKMDWIIACTEAMDLVNEDPYEVGLDILGCRDGPKNGRLRVSEGAPKLFSGLQFYFCGDFNPSYRKSLEELVLAAGAELLTMNSLVSRSGEGGSASKTLIVYNFDDEAPFTDIMKRRKEAEALAKQCRSVVIAHTWILGSIAALKLGSIPQLT